MKYLLTINYCCVGQVFTVLRFVYKLVVIK